jgi:iron only hydrogenase large subunit-like protein
MKSKNNITLIEKELKNKKVKLIALVAPSFACEFEYPSFIAQLKKLGFDKVVELTFGAKLVNHEYHKILENPKNKDKLWIASVCPATVEFVKTKYPDYIKNLMPVDSPMIAMAKVCKKFYPKHKTIFISPCHAKKLEADNSKYLDYVIDYQQLKTLIEKNKIERMACCDVWDRFYNDYTKIYPLSGGLSQTAHVKGVLHKDLSIILDGVAALDKFLKNPDKKIRFIDTSFCIGGCIGGPCISKGSSIPEKKKKILKYLELAKHEKIPAQKKGLLEKAQGIDFNKKF